MTASLRRKRAMDIEKKRKKLSKLPVNIEEQNRDEEQPSKGSGEEHAEDESGSERSGEGIEKEKDGSDNLQIALVTELPHSAGPSSSQATVSIPVSTTILKSFETHIAFAIWNKEVERGPLKCHSHTMKLMECSIDDLPVQVAQKIKNSGLYSLAQYSYKHVDYVTASAFVERWHPETNSFHMPFGEMTITLDDVAQILKIPVVGTCIYKNTIDSNPIDLLVDYLGVNTDEARKELNYSNSVKLNYLLSVCEEKAKKEDATEGDYEAVVRAYILFLLGCTLFCDKSGTKVSVNYLECLENVDQINEHAWGMGALSFLYRQLGLASRRDVRQLAGYLPLLTAWIYDHFPMLPNAIPSKDYNDTMPRLCKWQPMKQSGDTTSAIIRLREQLDDLTAQDVCWDPYHDVRSKYPLPEVAFYNGAILCFDIAEPYYPNRVLRQFGIAQRIPANPMAPRKCRRGKNANQYKIEYDNSYWYAANWQDHVLSAKSRSTRVHDPWDCTAKYLSWYLSISHPIIQHPDVRRTSSRKVDTAEKLRVAAAKAIEKLKENLGSHEKSISTCLNVERAAVDLLEEALNEPDKREKRKKGKHDRRTGM